MTTRKIQVASAVRAKQLTEEVKSEIGLMRTAWFRFACLVRQCLEERVPEALDMTATVWMRECGIESRARRGLRALKALAKVPEKALKQIPEGNAFALCRLPEKDRKTKEWVKRAAELPIKEFKREVSKTLEVKYHIEREKFETVTLRLPHDLADSWEAAIQKIAKVFSIDLLEKPDQRIECVRYICGIVDGLADETIVNVTVGSES